MASVTSSPQTIRDSSVTQSSAAQSVGTRRTVQTVRSSTVPSAALTVSSDDAIAVPAVIDLTEQDCDAETVEYVSSAEDSISDAELDVLAAQAIAARCAQVALEAQLGLLEVKVRSAGISRASARSSRRETPREMKPSAASPTTLL